MSCTPSGSIQTKGRVGWLWPIVASGAMSAGLLTGYVLICHGEVSALVCADRDKIGHWPFEAVRVGFATSGFDGQYYYVLARDPWSRHVDFIDLPAYRHARILFPAFAWAITGGDASLLLWALPLINWLALVGMAWLGALLATHYGRSPWWGFLFPFAVNALPPALRDLTDPLAMFAACGLLTAWLLRWRCWTFAVWGVLAVLSREQNLLIVALVLLESMARRRFSLVAALLVPVFLWLGWVLVLRQVYGTTPFVSGNTEFPFAGIWHRLCHMTGAPGSYSSPVHLIGMTTLCVQMALSVSLLCFRAERITRLIAISGVVLAILGGVSIYMNLESYTRVFWWMPLGVWLWSIQTGRCWPMLFLSVSSVWPAYALLQAWHNVQRGVITFL
jgi:hypothetical protein